MKRQFEALLDGPFDLLIIGGGIYGAWMADDAAMRGLRVALVEKEDWGSGTSQSSSKLIHGGLRYLEHREFGLVRKSLAERRILTTIAPHLVQPLRFVMPLYSGARVGRLRMKAGLWLYDRLAGSDQPVEGHGSLGRQALHEEYPFLSAEHLTGGFTYGDCQTDDARLTLDVVANANHFGAVTVNYAEALNLLYESDRVIGAQVKDLETEALIDLKAKVTVNCAGPWVQRVLGNASPSVTRLSKGVHLVLPQLPTTDAVILLTDDGRVVFLIPWYGRTLLGTTDTDYKGAPGFARAETKDVAYLLSQANRCLGDRVWEERDVIASFAGLRALPRSDDLSPATVSREWQFLEADSGLLSSVGGKYTSARADAAMAVDRMVSRLGITARPSGTHEQRLLSTPDETDLGQWRALSVSMGMAAGIDETTASVAGMRYGQRFEELVDRVKREPQLAARITPDAPFCMAEVDIAVEQEMARTLIDVLRRRIPLLVLSQPSSDVLQRVADRVGDRLNWDQVRRRHEVATITESHKLPAVAR